MILCVFCVRDRATDQYGNPMFLVNRGQAIRSFSDEINSKDDDAYMAKHSDDYDLYVLGTYDTHTGLFSVSPPEMICIGKSVKL